MVPLSWTMDHVGPLCRTIEGAALMLGVIAGHDELDPTTVDTPVPDFNRALRMQTSKLRLGILRTPFFDNLDPEIANAVAAAVEVLRKLTATVSETTLPPTNIPFDEIYNKCAAWKLTPTIRDGSPSRRKNTRQPLASGLSRIPRTSRRRIMSRLAVNSICFVERPTRCLPPWTF